MYYHSLKYVQNGFGLADGFSVEDFLFSLDIAVPEEGEGGNRYQYIEAANAFIANNYHKNVGREEAAEYAKCSKQYLCYLLKKHNDTTFTYLLNSYRINQAKLLLRQGIPVLKVSGMVGFSGHSYFINVFKRLAGMTPGEYSKEG